MIKLSKPISPINASINLSGSKSISNRLLIINHVLNLNRDLNNSSTSEDTVLLQKALSQIKNNHNSMIDVHHAGSDFRFLTALLSVSQGDWLLTGSDRLKQRPVGELVSALKSLGANIQYGGVENFPPLKISGKKLNQPTTEIDASVSSQFISALLLIAPTFENGLKICLSGEIVSWPYIQMTIALLQEIGVDITVSDNVIKIAPFKINNPNIFAAKTIESDWTSASYWYSICALSPGARIRLKHLHANSLQADAILPLLFSKLGVNTSFDNDTVTLNNIKVDCTELIHDFTDCPDIAQTVAVTCFGLGINAKLTGLKTLKIKETDRIVALKTEMEKFGAEVLISDQAIELKTTLSNFKTATPNILTYNDHRMAMSFAPLAILCNNINISEPEVVSKSYPHFWEDLKSAGFSVNLQA